MLYRPKKSSRDKRSSFLCDIVNDEDKIFFILAPGQGPPVQLAGYCRLFCRSGGNRSDCGHHHLEVRRLVIDQPEGMGRG